MVLHECQNQTTHLIPLFAFAVLQDCAGGDLTFGFRVDGCLNILAIFLAVKFGPLAGFLCVLGVQASATWFFTLGGATRFVEAFCVLGVKATLSANKSKHK